MALEIAATKVFLYAGIPDPKVKKQSLTLADCCGAYMVQHVAEV